MTTTKRPSTYRRLSRYLPQLNTNTKIQEIQPPPLPSKNLSPHLTEILNSQRPQHPARPPPPSPQRGDSAKQTPMKSNKLRKSKNLSSSTLTSTSTSTSPYTFSEDSNITKSNPQLPKVAMGSPDQPQVPCILNVPNGIYVDSDKESSPGKLRKSWLPGSRARSARLNNSDSFDEPQAWVNAGSAKIEYNLAPLLQGEKVQELWNNIGETFVYLRPRESGCPAQFRVPYAVIESSIRLRNLIRDAELYNQEKSDGRSSLVDHEITENQDVTENHDTLENQETMEIFEFNTIESPQYSPKQSMSDENSVFDTSDDAFDKPRQYHLYFPVDLPSFESPFTSKNAQKLVDVRNLFALLTRQPLVATRLCPTNFQNFLSISAILKEFDFCSDDGNTFGPAVDTAFSFCLKEIPQIADCRDSKMVTIEALILAEAMKSIELYNEAYAHAVGKYDALVSIQNGNAFKLVSSSTQNRLGKASRDLKQRIRSVNDRLSDFEFPSLFAGIAASNTMEEAKLVRFKQWKLYFSTFRKQVIAYYKELHGQWPPRASSRKNNFVECGLNRLVIRGLYNDLCDLYDFLVDRESLTTRVYDGDGMEEPSSVTPAAQALRKLLDEYDRSSPPVQPPIPCDIPLVPTIRSIDPTFAGLGPMDQHKKQNQRLNENEAALILTKSHNLDSDYKTPFIEMFKSFELKEAKGKTALELSEQRHGYWIFLYACLQALPLLVTDAPGLQYTDGVEYFLCQVPLGNLPWVEDQSQCKMSWFEVPGGQQYVSLPSDVVNNGVEAIYNRSHCWVAAKKWIEAEMHSTSSESPIGDDFSPLSPPPGFDRNGFALPGGEGRRQRSIDASSQCSSQMSGSSRGHPKDRNRPYQRSSIALGLERVHVEPDENYGLASTPRCMSPSSINRNTQSRPGSRAQSRCGESSRDFGSSTFEDILGSMSADKDSTYSKYARRVRKKKK